MIRWYYAKGKPADGFHRHYDQNATKFKRTTKGATLSYSHGGLAFGGETVEEVQLELREVKEGFYELVKSSSSKDVDGLTLHLVPGDDEAIGTWRNPREEGVFRLFLDDRA